MLSDFDQQSKQQHTSCTYQGLNNIIKIWWRAIWHSPGQIHNHIVTIEVCFIEIKTHFFDNLFWAQNFAFDTIIFVKIPSSVEICWEPPQTFDPVWDLPDTRHFLRLSTFEIDILMWYSLNSIFTTKINVVHLGGNKQFS